MDSAETDAGLVRQQAWLRSPRALANAHIASHIEQCNTMQMPTNLALDDALIQAAQKAGGHRTKKAAVTAALEEYVRRRKQLELRALFGKVEYDEGYDHKQGRHR